MGANSCLALTLIRQHCVLKTPEVWCRPLLPSREKGQNVTHLKMEADKITLSL